MYKTKLLFLFLTDDMNLSWIQAVNIPKTLQNGDTYLHVAAKHGKYEIFEMILDSEEVKNPKNDVVELNLHNKIGGTTPFHLVCQYGHLRIVKMLLQRSHELNIGKFHSKCLQLQFLSYGCPYKRH